MKVRKRIHKKTIQKWVECYHREEILDLATRKGYITPQMIMRCECTDDGARVWALLHFLSFPSLIQITCDLVERGLHILEEQCSQDEIAIIRRVIDTKRKKPRYLTSDDNTDRIICDIENDLAERNYYRASKVFETIIYLGRITDVDDADYVAYLMREVFKYEDECREQIRLIYKRYKGDMKDGRFD